MGLFDIFSKKNYDMDTLEGINAIPVPAKNFGNDLKDQTYYMLQRKATEHKKNGHMDLAIACLRKSNELSDYELRPLLMPKEYFRLVKYLEYNNQHEEATAEEKRINQRHPEFKDKRILNLKNIRTALQHNLEIGEDCVLITTTSYCPYCQPYNHKVFSISGRSRKYPKLPKEFSLYGGFCPNCFVGICTFFEGISTEPKAPHPQFQCPRCGKPFSGRLKSCKHCNLIFNWENYDAKTKNNKKILSPEFQCPRCHFSFSGRPEKCSGCGLIFTWDTYDRKHSRKI